MLWERLQSFGMRTSGEHQGQQSWIKYALTTLPFGTTGGNWNVMSCDRAAAPQCCLFRRWRSGCGRWRRFCASTCSGGACARSASRPRTARCPTQAPTPGLACIHPLPLCPTTAVPPPEYVLPPSYLLSDGRFGHLPGRSPACAGQMLSLLEASEMSSQRLLFQAALSYAWLTGCLFGVNRGRSAHFDVGGASASGQAPPAKRQRLAEAAKLEGPEVRVHVTPSLHPACWAMFGFVSEGHLLACCVLV